MTFGRKLTNKNNLFKNMCVTHIVLFLQNVVSLGQQDNNHKEGIFHRNILLERFKGQKKSDVSVVWVDDSTSCNCVNAKKHFLFNVTLHWIKRQLTCAVK